MAYSTPGLLTDESRWLAKNSRFLRMLIHGQASSETAIRTVSTDYSTTDTDFTILVDTTASNVTITLGTPPKGKVYNIKKIHSDSNHVTIATTSGTIDGSATATISTYNQTDTVQYDGNNYYIL